MKVNPFVLALILAVTLGAGITIHAQFSPAPIALVNIELTNAPCGGTWAQWNVAETHPVVLNQTEVWIMTRCYDGRAFLSKVPQALTFPMNPPTDPNAPQLPEGVPSFLNNKKKIGGQ